MSKLPPRNDPQREEREREAIQTRDKVTQVTDALREGKLPSTEQVTKTIESVQSSDVLHGSAHGMSPLGKKVLADTEKLLDSTRRLFEEKNVGDELQNVIYYGGKSTKDLGTSATVPADLKNKVSKEASASQSLVQDAVQKTLIIPQLLMSSSEFRKLINDVHSILQEALLQGVPGKEVQTSGVGSDQEKTIQEAKEETAQQARESTYPVAKEAANITGTHVKDFSEGNKGFQETATGGAKELATHFKNKVTRYQLNEEQRDILVERFKKVILETQSRPEYQEVLEDLVNIISQLGDKSKSVTDHAVSTAKTQAGGATDKTDLQIAQENAKRLIENFANHKSLDPLINSLRDLGNNVQRDGELKSYLSELKQFVLSSLRDRQFVEETDYIEHGSRLIDRGRHLLLERYSDDTQRVADETIAFNRALQDDTLTSQWSSDFETLVNDLFLDERGQPTIKFELLKDFSKILKVVGEKMKYIPLPRIENSDEEYDYIFDNIVLYLAEILPKHLHVSFTADINLARDENNVLENTAFIEISKINADARNIAFYYKKKKGLINMVDVGLVDFSIPKNGLTIKLKILLNPPNEANPALDIRVLEADTTIDELKLRLHDTKHDFLYTLLAPIVEMRLKKQLANMISEKMVKSVEYIKENVVTLQSQFLNNKGNNNNNDNKRKGGKTHGPHVGDKKHKHAWQSQHFNSETQVKEE